MWLLLRMLVLVLLFWNFSFDKFSTYHFSALECFVLLWLSIVRLLCVPLLSASYLELFQSFRTCGRKSVLYWNNADWRALSQKLEDEWGLHEYNILPLSLYIIIIILRVFLVRSLEKFSSYKSFFICSFYVLLDLVWLLLPPLWCFRSLNLYQFIIENGGVI